MNKEFLSPNQLALIKTGNKIETPDGQIFYNYPFWIKEIEPSDPEDKSNVELYTRAQLPVEKSFKKGGLIAEKYYIQKADGTPMDPEAFYFVLRVDKDPHAQKAAIAYAQSVESDNPLLAKELMEKVRQFNPEI